MDDKKNTETISGQDGASGSRKVGAVIAGTPTSDGAGVKLTRVIGGRRLDYVDPFLLLDEFKSDDPDDYIAGFPPHPHRGIETVTYMLEGRMEHEDSLGHKGVIGPGDMQWMTAGSGIIHSEMPAQENGRMWGLQLWVNLPRRRKMMDPRYRDLVAGDIPEVAVDGCRVKVIAGRFEGTDGPLADIEAGPTYLDVTLEPGARFVVSIRKQHNVCAYVLSGEGTFGPDRTKAGASRMVLFGEGDTVEAATDDSPLRFILLSGAPLNEPVARGGPFVMNTEEEIIQAWQEYRDGTFVKA